MDSWRRQLAFIGNRHYEGLDWLDLPWVFGILGTIWLQNTHSLLRPSRVNSSRLSLQITDFTALYAVHHSGFSMSPSHVLSPPLPVSAPSPSSSNAVAPGCWKGTATKVMPGFMMIPNAKRFYWHLQQFSKNLVRPWHHVGEFWKTGWLYIIHWFVKIVSSIHTNTYSKTIHEINIHTTYRTHWQSQTYIIYIYKSWKHR